MTRWLGLLVAVGLVGAADAGVVRHVLWDANQRPLYQRCAIDFEAAHPSIRIRIQQMGWDDYWSSLSTGFISDTAPDVFTNHLSKYPEFVDNAVLADLTPLIVRDKVVTDIYEDGLLSMWRRDGHQYAMPADWDTIALIVNLDMARRAGIDLKALRNMDWNPRDGGSFAQIMARLTRDEAGRDATMPGFDALRVKTYGYQTPGAGGMMGQTEWSHFAVSSGWRFQAKAWDPELLYDDPKLIDTMSWLASLPQKGLVASSKAMGRLGAEVMFVTGRAAMVPAGSWMISHFSRHASFAHAWVPLPVGPTGHRASMRNGLAHSIWAGSKNKSEAWLWVRHLGSRECQAKVAEGGVVYPAVKGLAELALAAQAKQGADASVFLETARGFTFAPPIASHAAEINDLMNAALESVLSGSKSASKVLREVAPQVREITRRP
jgi:multiple sugar transport system substrate-binding protein